MIVRVMVALAVVVAVASCTDDTAAPTTLPQATLSPSESSGPTELPSPPAEANAHTPEGAAAFVRFYIGLINDAYETGASEPLRAYATDECDSCTSIAGAVDDIYADGGRAIGGQLTINDLTPTGVAEGVQTSVVAETTVSRFQETDAKGNVVDEVAEQARTFLFDIDRNDDRWAIGGIRNPQAGTP